MVVDGGTPVRELYTELGAGFTQGCQACSGERDGTHRWCVETTVEI